MRDRRLTDSAKAITFGPSGHGSGSGYVFCDQIRHELTFNYSAQADTQILMGQNSSAINVAGTSQLIVSPMWIEVASYVKPASYGSWVLMHDDTLLLNRASNQIVTRLTVPAGRGNYWTAGFYVRVGTPAVSGASGSGRRRRRT